MPACVLFETLCIRADAGASMGIGHVMRCLALAQAWQARGGRVVFLTKTDLPELIERITADCIEVRRLEVDPAGIEDALQTSKAVREACASCLILDGYHFAADYLAAIKNQRINLIVIDDLSDRDLSSADIILNQNDYASPEMYARSAPQSQLLLGTRFALLRREFLFSRPRPSPDSPHATKILISLGGCDPDNATMRVLTLLADFQDIRLDITVVVGPANPHLECLQQVLPEHHDAKIVVNPSNLPELMSCTDIAISAAGSSCWELASLGATMLLVVIADNQVGIAERLISKNAAGILGDDLQNFRTLVSDRQLREQLANNARKLVDGRGASRAAENIAGHPLSLRPASMDDARLLWEWANDPLTRQASFHSDRIPWATHLAWLQQRIESTDSKIYIAEIFSQSAGMVRFDREPDGSAQISISISPASRGRGLGAKLIRLGTFSVLDEGFCHEVCAWVKLANAASIHAFLRAGYVEHLRAVQHGKEAIWLRSQKWEQFTEY